MTKIYYLTDLLFLSFCFLSGQTFNDESSRLTPVSGNVQWGVSAIDYNNDGQVDIFHRNTLYLNHGDAFFTNEYETSGLQDGQFIIGGLFGDYDNDGYLDVLVLDFSGPSLLYKNRRLGTFLKVNQQAGVTVNDLPEGGGWSDFNRDGKLDLFIGNDLGHNQLFENLDRKSFADISESANLLLEADTYGAAWGDYNNDGWMDIFTTGEPSDKLLLNNGGNNHWLMVKARGVISNYHGIGTRIEVFTEEGIQIREINAGDSFNSQNDLLNAHFGLGQNVVIDSIVCRWPSGTIDVIKNIFADQRITLVEGVGINQTPGTFNLVSPLDDANLAADSITFFWRRPLNPESEDYTYRLYLRSENADSVITILNDTSAIVNLAFFEPGSIISWSVDVSDSYSVTASTDIFDLQTIVSGIIKEGINPDKFILFQNYPNPFNPLTRIEYILSEPASVSIKIYDLSGREVKTLVKKERQKGSNYTTWDGRNDKGKVVASGIYFYSLEVSHKAFIYRKLLFLK